MMKTRKGYPVYPLTVAQKFHLYYLPFCPNAAVLNIGTSLTIGTDLDRDVLRESIYNCLLYTSPSPRDVEESRMPSSA